MKIAIILEKLMFYAVLLMKFQTLRIFLKSVIKYVIIFNVPSNLFCIVMSNLVRLKGQIYFIQFKFDYSIF